MLVFGTAITADEPSAPATVTRADGSLNASWDAVEGATSYHITYSSDGGHSWKLAALNHPDSSITISGVDNAATYMVSVRVRGRPRPQLRPRLCTGTERLAQLPARRAFRTAPRFPTFPRG